MKKNILVLLFIIYISPICSNATDFNKNKFSFAFLTDIHLNKGDNNCFEGIDKAIKSAKLNDVDFIITGGDNVDIDVLGNDADTAHELYKRYAEIIESSDIDYYAAIGNHDRFLDAKNRMHCITKECSRNTSTKVITLSITRDGILLCLIQVIRL